MIDLIFGLVVVICYVTLWRPERAFKRGWRYWVIGLVALVYAALATLSTTGEKPFFSLLFVAFPLFYGVLLRDVVRRVFRALIRSHVGRIILVFALIWFSEIFAALDIASYDPVGRHMMVYIGFYIGLTLVIVYFLSRWRFTFPSLFILGGLWGLLVERQFAGTQMLLHGDFISFLIFASVIFPVYGFYLAGPYLLLYEEWNTNTHTNRWQYVLLFIAVSVLPLVTWGIWVLIIGALRLYTTVFGV